MAAKRIIARALVGGTRWCAMTSAVLAGVMLWLCLGSGSALAAVPQFGMENAATQLCGSSGSGAPGTVVRQESCSEYSSHDGSYQEYWATEDLTPGVHLARYQYYNDQKMCLTIRRGELEVGTPLLIQPCGGALALGQLFDKLEAVDGGSLLRAYAESGRRVENPTAQPSDFCVASNGGVGAALVLQRCNNRLTRQSWLGLGDEGTPGLPGPGDPTK